MQKLRTERIGETRLMSNGMNATIINYHGANNIDVEFEDGAILKKRRYEFFCKGQLKHPMIIDIIGNYAKVTNINTNPESIFLMDVEDLHLITNRHCCISLTGYAQIKDNGQMRQLHRLIMDPPSDMEIDHINGDRTDNRKSNLRICGKSENIKNVKKRKDNTSGWKGVRWLKNRRKWLACLQVDGKYKHLGHFNTPEEAAKAYNRGAIKYHGEFAKLNKI